MDSETLAGPQTVQLSHVRVDLPNPLTRLIIRKSLDPYFELYEAFVPTNRVVALLRIRRLDPQLSSDMPPLDVDLQLESCISAGHYLDLEKSDSIAKTLANVVPEKEASFYYRGDRSAPNSLAISLLESASAVFIEVPITTWNSDLKFLLEELESSIQVEISPPSS